MTASIITSSFLIAIAIGLVTSESLKYSPLILVPGDGGSKLYARSKDGRTDSCGFGPKWALLWLNLKTLLPQYQTCICKRIQLYYNRQLKKPQNFSGLEVDTLDWGGTSSIDYLGDIKTSFEVYFAKLSDYLVQNGYVRNVNLRGAPFDFRITPDENDFFIGRFKALVEDTYFRNSASRVMLLGHSMGNLYINYFLKRMSPWWKSKYLRGCLAVAPSMGGAVDAVLAETTGLGSSYGFLNMDNVRMVLRSFPTIGVNFPSPLYWSHHEVLARRPGREYTISNFRQLFEDVNNDVGWKMYKKSMKLVTTQWQPDLDEVYCMHGIDVPTPEKLEWESDYAFPNFPPKIHHGNGDGTVNEKSFKACKQWYGVKVMKYPGAGHKEILRDPRFLADVLHILRVPTPNS